MVLSIHNHMMHYANNHEDHKFKHTMKRIAVSPNRYRKQIFVQVV